MNYRETCTTVQYSNPLQRTVLKLVNGHLGFLGIIRWAILYVTGVSPAPAPISSLAPTHRKAAPSREKARKLKGTLRTGEGCLSPLRQSLNDRLAAEYSASILGRNYSSLEPNKFAPLSASMVSLMILFCSHHQTICEIPRALKLWQDIWLERLFSKISKIWGFSPLYFGICDLSHCLWAGEDLCLWNVKKSWFG